MSNTLGVPEVLRAVLADSTQHDTFGLTERKTVRVTDHADDQGVTGDDYHNMAIFECRGRGYPWVKKDNVLQSVIHVGLLPPATVTTLFPDWDYATF